MAMVQERETTRHVAMLTSPGMGHLIPILEFAKRLIHHHNISVTCIVPTNGPPSSGMKDVLKALPPNVGHIFIPIMDLPKDAKSTKLISMVMKLSVSPLRDILKSLIAKTNLVALIVDLFSTEGFDIADELNLSSYMFFPSNAMFLSFMFYMPKLNETVDSSIEFRNLNEPVQIPGCVPIYGRDLSFSVQDRKGEGYEWFLYHCKRYRLAKGIAINSFLDMEPCPLKALKDDDQMGSIPPVFSIGPIIRTVTESIDSIECQEIRRGDNDSICLKWLDQQSKGSVLFVSFGSGGTLSINQLEQLALGLELSGQRFLWVVRTPNDTSPNAAYFDSQSPTDPLSYLPYVKIALRPNDHNKNVGEVVDKEEISRVVESLMVGKQGKEVRSRVMKIKKASFMALKNDGASTKALDDDKDKYKALLVAIASE
ncbi:hypothetical protein ACFE04_026640 [Oxalis oulophora]